MEPKQKTQAHTHTKHLHSGSHTCVPNPWGRPSASIDPQYTVHVPFTSLVRLQFNPRRSWITCCADFFLCLSPSASRIISVSFSEYSLMFDQSSGVFPFICVRHVALRLVCTCAWYVICTYVLVSCVRIYMCVCVCT